MNFSNVIPYRFSFIRKPVFVLAFMILLGESSRAADPEDPFDQPVKAEVKLVPAKPKNNSPTNSRIDFEIGVSPRHAKRGQTVKLVIKGILKPGYHTYPITKKTSNQDAAQLSSLNYEESSNFAPLFPLTETEPEEVLEEGLAPDGLKTLFEHNKDFTWFQEILILPDAKPGPQNLAFQIKLQVCDRTCVLGQPKFEETITVLDAPAVPVSQDILQRLAKPKQVDSKQVLESDSPPKKEDVVRNITLIAETELDYKAGMETIQNQIKGGAEGTPPAGLLAFMLSGVFWGAVSLVTPCVFPMIPITVSFFLKQSEKAHYRPLTMALVYCLTIVVVLTFSAFALLSFFQWLSTNPAMNIALGVLFVVFSLSLFGMFDLELPSGLARFTSSREGQGGLVGVMFMALTFTIVSFACVAPFLGGFAGTSTGIGPLFTILGGLAFAVTFASPFFVLALFPALLKNLPKSGSWLNSVKVIMGFLELAAAVKFFRAGELFILPTPTFFTFDLSLGMYIALALLCGLYLLNVYRLPLDSPTENIGVPRMLFGFLFLSLSFYLAPALFKFNSEGAKQRPNGTIYSWIESFLLPEVEGKEDLAWSGNLPRVVEDARKLRQQTGKTKLIFIDFTGKL